MHSHTYYTHVTTHTQPVLEIAVRYRTFSDWFWLDKMSKHNRTTLKTNKLHTVKVKEYQYRRKLCNYVLSKSRNISTDVFNFPVQCPFKGSNRCYCLSKLHKFHFCSDNVSAAQCTHIIYVHTHLHKHTYTSDATVWVIAILSITFECIVIYCRIAIYD